MMMTMFSFFFPTLLFSLFHSLIAISTKASTRSEPCAYPSSLLRHGSTKHSYKQCGPDGNYVELPCVPNTIFSFKQQNCIASSSSELSSNSTQNNTTDSISGSFQLQTTKTETVKRWSTTTTKPLPTTVYPQFTQGSTVSSFRTRKPLFLFYTNRPSITAIAGNAQQYQARTPGTLEPRSVHHPPPTQKPWGNGNPIGTTASTRKWQLTTIGMTQRPRSWFEMAAAANNNQHHQQQAASYSSNEDEVSTESTDSNAISIDTSLTDSEGGVLKPQQPIRFEVYHKSPQMSPHQYHSTPQAFASNQYYSNFQNIHAQAPLNRLKTVTANWESPMMVSGWPMSQVGDFGTGPGIGFGFGTGSSGIPVTNSNNVASAENSNVNNRSNAPWTKRFQFEHETECMDGGTCQISNPTILKYCPYPGDPGRFMQCAPSGTNGAGVWYVMNCAPRTVFYQSRCYTGDELASMKVQLQPEHYQVLYAQQPTPATVVTTTTAPPLDENEYNNIFTSRGGDLNINNNFAAQYSQPPHPFAYVPAPAPHMLQQQNQQQPILPHPYPSQMQYPAPQQISQTFGGGPLGPIPSPLSLPFGPPQGFLQPIPPQPQWPPISPTLAPPPPALFGKELRNDFQFQQLQQQQLPTTYNNPNNQAFSSDQFQSVQSRPVSSAEAASSSVELYPRNSFLQNQSQFPTAEQKAFMSPFEISSINTQRSILASLPSAYAAQQQQQQQQQIPFIPFNPQQSNPQQPSFPIGPMESQSLWAQPTPTPSWASYPASQLQWPSPVAPAPNQWPVPLSVPSPSAPQFAWPPPASEAGFTASATNTQNVNAFASTLTSAQFSDPWQTTNTASATADNAWPQEQQQQQHKQPSNYNQVPIAFDPKAGQWIYRSIRSSESG